MAYEPTANKRLLDLVEALQQMSGEISIEENLDVPVWKIWINGSLIYQTWSRQQACALADLLRYRNTFDFEKG